MCLQKCYLRAGVLLVRVCKGDILKKNDSYFHTLYLLEINFYVIKDPDRRHLMLLPSNTYMNSDKIHQWFLIHQNSSMAEELFWTFGRNEETNKKIRKHHSFEEY